ncbi:MAG: hypothetical protein ACOH1O_00265 [Flavobacterium sp.]
MPRKSEWLKSSKIKYKENLLEGFENIPSAFIGLFTGENIGKQMVKVRQSREHQLSTEK